MFQFPSNGKAHVNEAGPGLLAGFLALVSIPFKRESTCKLLDTPASGAEDVVSIPFKRESTCKRRFPLSTLLGATVSIPFKRESTCKLSTPTKQPPRPLVSIPFKRKSTCKPTDIFSPGIPSHHCFNSLQTGKHM